MRLKMRTPVESIAAGAARSSGRWSDMDSVASVAVLGMATRVLRLAFAACPLGAWPDKHPAHCLYGATAKTHQQKVAHRLDFNVWLGLQKRILRRGECPVVQFVTVRPKGLGGRKLRKFDLREVPKSRFRRPAGSALSSCLAVPDGPRCSRC